MRGGRTGGTGRDRGGTGWIGETGRDGGGTEVGGKNRGERGRDRGETGRDGGEKKPSDVSLYMCEIFELFERNLKS